MIEPKIAERDRKRVDRLVSNYLQHQKLIGQFRDSLVGAIVASEVMGHIHSIRTRLKDPEHLREKLFRKMLAAKSDRVRFDVTPDNLLLRINDLAGVRLLHLYTRQIRDIDQGIRAVLKEQRYELLEGPIAKTWDDESRMFFEECGIGTQESPSLYTSVHYVVGSASLTQITCEIQVRTLMEEVWGEVDHTINYPTPTNVLACREQLRVLARITSGATRLVDSIFLTIEDQQTSPGGRRKPRK